MQHSTRNSTRLPVWQTEANHERGKDDDSSFPLTKERVEKVLTLTLEIGNQKKDIMVRPDQRMSEVLKVLKDNQIIFFQIDKLMIYSMRKKEYVNQRLTFRQAEIFTGDILVLK